MDVTFKPGDRIKIVKAGCNNTGCPEGSLDSCLNPSEYAHTIARVETKGKYNATSYESYTLILTSGHPVWSSHCELVVEEIKNNYNLY